MRQQYYMAHSMSSLLGTKLHISKIFVQLSMPRKSSLTLRGLWSYVKLRKNTVGTSTMAESL